LLDVVPETQIVESLLENSNSAFPWGENPVNVASWVPASVTTNSRYVIFPMQAGAASCICSLSV
jgi:hypothetical protein